MIGNKYELKQNEEELLEIEKDLAKHLKVPFVKCSYDGVNSHKYEDKHELESRKKFAKETGFWDMCDFIINYEKYKKNNHNYKRKVEQNEQMGFNRG